MTALCVRGSPVWMRVLALALLSTLTALGTARAEQPAATGEARAQETPPAVSAEQPAAESAPPPPPRPDAQMAPAPAPRSDAPAALPARSTGYEPPVVTEPVPVYSGASFPTELPIQDDGSCETEKACGAGYMCHRNRCVPSRVEGYGFPVAVGHVLLGPFGSSIAHFAYEQRGKGLASLGGGVGSFLIGGYFGCRVTADPCGRADFVVGGALVYTAFAIIDIAVLAKREVPDVPRSAMPILVPSNDGLVGGVRAEF